jgi:hypothetical protein
MGVGECPQHGFPLWVGHPGVEEVQETLRGGCQGFDKEWGVICVVCGQVVLLGNRWSCGLVEGWGLVGLVQQEVRGANG